MQATLTETKLTLSDIKSIADKNGVRVSVKKENGKRVIILRGFIQDIGAVVWQLSKYRVEFNGTAAYLHGH